MEEQLTIFDFLETEKAVKWHPIIDELSDDVHKIFSSCDIREEAYHVWDHVPNLGKRYEAWIDVNDKELVMNVSLDPMIEKYKRKLLDVSVVAAGSLKEGYSHSLMVSSLWNTKGHKEVSQ